MQHPNRSAKFTKRFTFGLALAAAVTLLFNSRAEPAGGGSAPVIVSAPQSVNAVIGESLTLSVEAQGAHSLRYCWRKDGRVIHGATGQKLKVKTAQPSAAGDYTVEIVNQYGRTVSAVAQVRVCGPNLRIYRENGIKLTFKASKGIRYAIECKNVLSEEAAWKPFATVQNRKGTVQLTDHSEASQLLCVFRLKAEIAGDCDSGHHDDDDDSGNDGEHHDDDDDDSDEDHDDDDDHHGDDDDDDHHGDDDDE